MKTIITTFLKINLIIWVLLSSNTMYAQIESTGFGGLWTDGATWIGGIAPGPTDDVIINGPVLLNVNTSCNNITVAASGLFSNYNSAGRTLMVDANITNYGTIQNYFYNLTLQIHGNIVNEGIWQNYSTSLIGDFNQQITSTTSFDGAYFLSLKASGYTYANSSLRFNNTIVDFNGDSLYMNVGNDSIFIQGSYTQEISIIANASPWKVYCHLSGGAYLNDVVIESEDAVLDGNVEFTTFFHIIGNARVEGILQTRPASSYTANVFGNLINNGTIKDNSYYTYLHITGDITQNGVWNNYHTYLDGDADQNFLFTESFDGSYLTNTNTNGKVISHSSLTFNNTLIDFNYDTLMFAAGADSLAFYGLYFQEGVIIKEASKSPGFLNCTMGGNAYFHDMIVVGDNIDLGGIFQFSSPMAFYGHVTVNDTLQTLAASSYTAYVYGDLTNNGTIKDNSYFTYLHITGDIIQNGIWNNYHTYLLGDSDQNLFFTQSFGGAYLTNSNIDGKLIANSTLDFNSTIIDFNYDTLMFAEDADSLILHGQYFMEAVIIKENIIVEGGSKTPGFLNCTMSGNAYFHDMIIVGDNIDLGGVFQFYSPMDFYGHVTVTDTLQTRASGSYTAYVNGGLTNNGTIKNNAYNTTLYISGDISQNGVWGNYYTYFNGSSLQNLSQTSPFTCYRIVDSDPASPIQANTDIEFQNTDVDLGGATLFMFENGMITIQDCWFVNADIVSSSFGISMAGNSYLEDVSLENVTLYDWVQVRNGCVFSGLTKVEGILSCHASISPTIDIDGNIINNGSIQNNSYLLSMNITGNAFNNGAWTNYRTTFNGTNDQQIYLLNNQEITGTVYFSALSAGSPYQWYYEGGILNSTSFTGETTNNLVWSVPVSPTWYGDFYCQTGAGPSRTISIEGGLIVDISLFLEGPFNGTGMNTTINDIGNVPVAQPYNSSPWNYSGTESVASVPADIVDWVLLEFRETTGGPETATPGTIISQRALFLHKDGYLVNLDGMRDIKLNVPTVTGSLYVIVWHRNHLGIMTASPLSFDSAPYAFDFTSGESQAYGGALGQNDIGSGLYGMMGGDANSDGDVDGDDFLLWQNNAGSAAVYDRFDLNMDNQVENTDKNDVLVGNSGQSSQIPE